MSGTLVLSGTTPLQVTTTTPGSGKVLVSDSAGNVSWGTAGSSGVTVPLTLSGAQASASILSLTNTTAAPSSPIEQLTAASTTDQVVGVKASGDTGQRLVVYANGQHSFGLGVGATDIDLYHPISGVLAVSGTWQAATLQGGASASGTLTLSSTSSATKGKVLVGTSAYDEVNNRLGVGTASPAYTLDVNGTANLSAGLQVAVATYAANHTATASDNVMLASAASGSVTITLPTAVGITGRTYTIKRTDATYANTVTVATTLSQTIDGAATYTALWVQYAYVQVVSDGANWQILDASAIPEPWQAMTLQNSWTNQGGTNVTAQYRRTSIKRVEVVALITHASVTGTSTIATLVSPYLAAHDQTINGLAGVTNSSQAYITVVASTGALTLNNLSSSTNIGVNGSYSLDA